MEYARRPPDLRLVPATTGVSSDASRLPTKARWLIASAVAASAAWSAPIVPSVSGIDLPAVIALVGLAMASERFDINLYGDSRVSLSALFIITAAITLGPAGALVVGPGMALAGHMGRGRPLYKLAFNLAVFVIAGLAAAQVVTVVLQTVRIERHTALALASVVAGLVNLVVSSMLVAAVISFTGGGPVRQVWREKFLWLIPHFAMLGFMAFVLTLAYRELGVWGLLGFTAPAMMMRFTMKQYVDRTERTVSELRSKNSRIEQLSTNLRDAYAETLHALVTALDTRDTETHGHSARVAETSLRIARELGMDPHSEAWRNLEYGAMLHDVGKIGVPDAILRKAGPLTADEWKAIRKHPEHGHAMLHGVRFLESAAELVLCHHESFDGSGYPRGLRGEEIPLAARIFAVSDTYDAITSARSYKPARTSEEAIREIQRMSGTQFDPRVVAAFIASLGRARRAA